MHLNDFELVAQSIDFSTQAWVNFELRIQGVIVMAFASIAVNRSVQSLVQLLEVFGIQQEQIRRTRELLLISIANGLEGEEKQRVLQSLS